MEVRSDYESRDTWSYAECAQWAGVSWTTVRKWMYMGKFLRGRAIGGYPVDAESYKKFIRTGESAVA